ncbi:MAG: hypothetical protein HY272_02785 [Gammaproteobacteria bacterium]|nr:hypothetical protein [Gammaproteobacteria bacterium]
MSQKNRKQPASLSRRGRGFTVTASPFNGVKLDLAIVMVIGGLVWLIHDRLVSAPLGQLVLLASYGLGAMCWIIYKTRRVMRSLPVAGRQDNGA